MITLMPQQQAAFNLIKRFIEDNDSQVFILKGYAGTGKTTMLSYVVKYLEAQNRFFMLMAPTGRAAKVISEKTGHEARTIHKSIYTLSKIEEVIVDGDIQNVQYYFPLVCNNEIPLCLVDEASMVGTVKHNEESLRFGSGSLLCDLIDYSKLASGGKLIFVGDPAQLPPVGDNKSNALNEEFFRSKGINVCSFELTEVLRQKSESTILKNSIAIRDALSNPLSRTLQLISREGEVENVPKLSGLIERNVDLLVSGESVVIAYTNRDALYYNTIIRKAIFGESCLELNVGDRVIFAANNYSSSVVMLNGDFATVTAVSERVERQSAPVYAKRGDKESRKIISLCFRDVELELSSGIRVQCKIIDSLLNSNSSNLTWIEQMALYINFKIRYSERLGRIEDPKIRKEAERSLYMGDPYVNAARVKYGYAITGHKSQGGEWRTVYADFYNRALLNPDCLRWIYTVMTRPSERLVAASLPFTCKTSTLEIRSIGTMGKMSADLLGNVVAPDVTPFHTNSVPAGVRAKFVAIEHAMKNSPCSISRVESRPYLEMYHINTPSGHVRVDGRYDKSGFVTFKSDDAELAALLNDNSALEFKMEYEPSRENFRLMYNKISSAAAELDITIASVVEYFENYKIAYNMLSDKSVMRIDLFFGKDGMFTYAAPMSTLGDSDGKLKQLLTLIQ